MSELSTGLDSKRDSKGFIKPYYIEDLKDLGVTSRDIAESLGVEHRNITEKLHRIDVDLWQTAGWNFAVCTAKTTKKGIRGRHQKTWCLNIRAAKAFVARWNNEKGVGYLNFLFSCEAAAPKLIEEIASLRQERAQLQLKIEILQKPRHRYIPGQGTVAYLVEARMTKDMFGNEYVEKIRKAIKVDKLTECELREWRIQHRAAIMEGISKKQKEEIDDRATETLPPDRRGKLIPFLWQINKKGDL